MIVIALFAVLSAVLITVGTPTHQQPDFVMPVRMA